MLDKVDLTTKLLDQARERLVMAAEYLSIDPYVLQKLKLPMVVRIDDRSRRPFKALCCRYVDTRVLLKAASVIARPSRLMK